MNPIRFCKKLLTNPSEAKKSFLLVSRGLYGTLYWFLNPAKPLPYRLPTGGIFYLERDHSFTKCFWPAVDRYEPDLQFFIKKLLMPGATFIDAGANVGFYSVLASDVMKHRGRIISIEAGPETFKLLQRNVGAIDCITPVQYVLSSQNAPTSFFIAAEGDVFSSTKTSGMVSPSLATHLSLEGITLDNLLKKLGIQNVDFLKLDIEGAELEVLDSAPSLVKNIRPIISIEYGLNTWPKYEATYDDLHNFAKRVSYSMYAIDLTLQSLVPPPAEIRNKGYVNIIIVPNEKIKKISQLGLI